jgi:phage tail-like protein
MSNRTTEAGPVVNQEYLQGWFRVEIGNEKLGAFTDAGGLSIELNVVEVTDTNVDTVTRKTPGVAKYGEITLKRKMTKNKFFYDWVKKIRDGEEVKKDGAVTLHDIAGKETGRWTFTNSWPSKWSASDLDVGQDDPMEEEITLVIEHLKRDK